MALSPFVIFEFCFVICIPLLLGQTLWLWTMVNLDKSSSPSSSSSSSSLTDEDQLSSLDIIESKLESIRQSNNYNNNNNNNNKFLKDLKLMCIIEVPIYNDSYHIQSSWGADCTSIYYFHYVHNTTDKIRQLSSFYNLKTSYNSFDWIVHVSSTTYLIIQNLVSLLNSYPIDVPILIGHNSKALILSNGLVQFMLTDEDSGSTKLYNKQTLLEYIFNSEKLDEKTLRNYKVFYGSTKDSEGSERFLDGFGKTINGSIFNFKIQMRLHHNLKYGSKTAIAIPNLSPEGFIAMDYLLYKLKFVTNSILTSSNEELNNLESPDSKSNESNPTIINRPLKPPPPSSSSSSLWLNSYEMNETELNQNYLAKQVKILCMILTGPRNHLKKAIHVKHTWGRRCNILVFLSSTQDPILKSSALPNVQEGREYLWRKMQLGFQYVYKYFYNQVDWFFKADDDTYTIMENLRELLKNYNSSQPQYLGLRLKGNFTHPWVTGGAGYVISKAGLKLLVEESLSKSSNDTDCPLDLLDVPEDVFTSLCLHNLNISYIDTRDEFERQRFFQHAVKDVVNGQIPEFFYEEYQYYPIAKDINCCSSSAISFHYIEPFQMYEMEYIIYQLNPDVTRQTTF